MVKWLWNNDELGMWHTNVCFISECLVDTLCVSEANLTRSPLLFFSAGRPLLLSHGPSDPRPLFFCILWHFCFPVLFPVIFTPHSKIGRTLIWVCCCYLVAMSELPIMACLNSRKYTLQQHRAVAYGQSTVMITLLHWAAFVCLCEETFQRP